MHITLTIQRLVTEHDPYGAPKADTTRTHTLTLAGTPEQVQQGLDQLFDADRATGLRQEFGLLTSASAASDPR